MEPVVAKFRSFEEADAATLAYYQSLTPAERLAIVFALRRMAHPDDDDPAGRMARVCRVSQLERS